MINKEFLKLLRHVLNDYLDDHPTQDPFFLIEEERRGGLVIQVLDDEGNVASRHLISSQLISEQQQQEPTVGPDSTSQIERGTWI